MTPERLSMETALRAYLDGFPGTERLVEISGLVGFLSALLTCEASPATSAQLLYALADAAVGYIKPGAVT